MFMHAQPNLSPLPTDVSTLFNHGYLTIIHKCCTSLLSTDTPNPLAIEPIITHRHSPLLSITDTSPSQWMLHPAITHWRPTHPTKGTLTLPPHKFHINTMAF